MDGTTVWGTSDTFNLPPGGGINQTETIEPGVTGTTPAVATAPTATATPVAATPVPAANPALLLNNTGSSTFGLVCSGPCDSSEISGYFLGLPASSWIAVQWEDGLGNWQTVQGWEGTANSVDTNTGQLIQQWSVARAN